MPLKMNGFMTEKSIRGIRWLFKDEAGDALVPDTVTWTLTDVNGTVINSRSNVSATPAADMTIVLSGNDLALTSQTSKYETRIMTVVAVKGTMTFRESAEFPVKNLAAVT